ncbi:MAG TPA: hypothetical protein VMG08_12370 [Allosphingosinicella sp.]|nr:hypothetical protein [Allosphingosinicella sp.]
MKTTKSFMGLLMALVPILLIGGLLLYLNHVRTSFFGLLDGAMGPTMFGLAAIGVVFILLFFLKLRKAATPPAPPSARAGDRVDAAVAETRSDFDADAAFARYMAKRDAGGTDPSGAPSQAFGNAPARPGGFGRKGA